MTLSELNNRFLYVTDKELYGVSEYWSELEDVDNKLIGDCESYAITCKKHIEDFRDWNYHWCKLNGTGHCILVSPDGEYMIDNNVKCITPLDSYINNFGFTVTELRAYTDLELWWKFTCAKILRVWFKFRGKI